MPAEREEAERLLELIEGAYDAAVEPEKWPSVLAAAARYVGGFSAAIFSKTVSGIGGRIFHADEGIAPDYKASYFTTYAALDPANVGHIYAEIDQPISTASLFDVEEFRQTRFYREWAMPLGLVDFVCAPLEKVGDWAAMLGVFRHERDGVVDEPAMERMRRLTPHVRRAVLIGNVIEERHAHAATLETTLDQLSAAVLLVERNGRLVHVNAAGAGLIEERGPLQVTDGRLDSNSEIGEAFAAASRGIRALERRGISVPLASDEGVGFTAHVLPLTSGGRLAMGSEYGASAAIFVHRARLDVRSVAGLLAGTFSLSPAELRVALTIVETGGVAAAAETLGLGEATIKTHLHHVFSKTGTANQAELVKLVAGLAAPLRHEE